MRRLKQQHSEASYPYSLPPASINLKEMHYTSYQHNDIFCKLVIVFCSFCGALVKESHWNSWNSFIMAQLCKNQYINCAWGPTLSGDCVNAPWPILQSVMHYIWIKGIIYLTYLRNMLQIHGLGQVHYIIQRKACHALNSCPWVCVTLMVALLSISYY